LLHGVITALGTPLDEENRNLHEEGMRMQVAAQIKAGVNGLLCLGSMGMAQMHTPEVREQAIRATVEEAHGRVPVLVGCGDCSTARTTQYISVAEKYKPDGIVLIAPYFPKLTDDELLDYFVALADSSPIPVYIYDIPFFTNRPLSANFFKELAGRSTSIIGLKASGDFVVFRECVEHFRDDPHFSVYSGHSHLFDVATLMGADGIIDGLFALTPEIGVDIYHAASRNDLSAALEAQRRLKEVRDIVLIESVFGAFSFAMNLLGFPGNYACPPMRGITDNGKEQVREKLQHLGII
jgi:dihydrodipicolinate synthase/N-acetylneuraminate lyase